MGSAAGVEKVAARRAGLTVDEYRRRLASGLKWCTSCKEWHPRSAFTKDATRFDGLDAHCTRARRVPTTSDAPSRAERAAMASIGLAWCRDCRWWLPMDDVQRGQCRPHCNASAREYYRRSPELRAKRVARKRGVDPLPPFAAELLLETTGGLCAYGCGGKATTFDHVIPVASGGLTEPGNIVPACRSCNSKKRHFDPVPWIERMTDEALDLIMPTLTRGGALLDAIGY